jgi:hypothetical protein
MKRFKVSPNSVDLTRVFVRELGTTFADSSIQVNKDLEIVVEAEVRAAIFEKGAAYLIEIVVRDLMTNTQIPASPANHQGHMPWGPTPDHQFVWNVPAVDLAGRQYHVCEVIAILKIGVINPGVKFATSERFILTD